MAAATNVETTADGAIGVAEWAAEVVVAAAVAVAHEPSTVAVNRKISPSRP